jgi:exosome complex RNA-binding protein Rrp42 (RNase PH superfamily)
VQGPVNVVGKDIYGLDADGDGVGCESSVVNAGLENRVVPEDCKQVNREQVNREQPAPVEPAPVEPAPVRAPPAARVQ